MENMFCFQCQESAGGKGCTRRGVCGKEPRVAALQDMLVWLSKGLGAHVAAVNGTDKPVSREIFELLIDNLFTTITNANFDEQAIADRVRRTVQVRNALPQPETITLPAAALWSRDSDSPSLGRHAGTGSLHRRTVHGK